ncbi:MAG: DUF3800 domain-containing protein [Clostridia bacterium]|nr:DUF3800 domain-containing protein [Clostridia bacterium]
MPEEPRISSELSAELEANGVKSSIEGLVDFKTQIDNFLLRSDLTESDQKRVSDKMLKITLLYGALVRIVNSYKSNEEKTKKILSVLSQIMIFKDIKDVQDEVNEINLEKIAAEQKKREEEEKAFNESFKVDEEIVAKGRERIEKQIEDERKKAQKILDQRRKELEKRGYDIGPLDEYMKSVRATVVKPEEKSIAVVPKKLSFMDRMRIFIQDPELDWHQEDRDGKLVYVDESGNAKKTKNPKRYGLIARIRDAIKAQPEETNKLAQLKKQAQEKIKEIEEEIKSIAESVQIGTREYINLRAEQFKEALDNPSIKDVLERLKNSPRDAYSWVKGFLKEKKTLVKEMREDKITDVRGECTPEELTQALAEDMVRRGVVRKEDIEIEVEGFEH